MKFIYLILTFLLITFSSEETYALSDCEIENDSTTKTTAKITCTVDENSGINGLAFVDNYLKINGNDNSNSTTSATLGGCTAAVSTTTCTITCTSVTGATAGKYYILTEITPAVDTGVFSTTGKTGDGITLANAATPAKHYEGQSSSTSNDSSNDSSNNSSDSSNFLKYTLLYLLAFIF